MWSLTKRELRMLVLVWIVLKLVEHRPQVLVLLLN